MLLTLEQAARQALTLTERERAQLAHVLIASLESGEDFSEEWDAEVCRRVRGIDDGSARGRPVADVVREIRMQYE